MMLALYPCIIGKHTRKPFKSNSIRSTMALEIVHSDVCGPMSERNHDGYRYFIGFLDDFTHLVVIYLLRRKHEVLDKFKEYEAMASAHFNFQILRFITDNGESFMRIHSGNLVLPQEFKRFPLARIHHNKME